MKRYTKFDRVVDLNRAIKRIWKESKTATQFEHEVMEAFKVQQFYTWQCFKLLVEDLVGYKF